MSLILWLPKQVLRLLWQLIKSVLQTILLVVIVVFGLIYYSNHSNSILANKISTVTEQVVQIVDTLTQQPSTQAPQEKKTH